MCVYFFNEVKCVLHIHVNESLYNKHKWCKTIAGARVQPSGRHLVRGSGSLLGTAEGKKMLGKNKNKITATGKTVHL